MSFEIWKISRFSDDRCFFKSFPNPTRTEMNGIVFPNWDIRPQTSALHVYPKETHGPESGFFVYPKDTHGAERLSTKKNNGISVTSGRLCYRCIVLEYYIEYRFMQGLREVMYSRERVEVNRTKYLWQLTLFIIKSRIVSHIISNRSTFSFLYSKLNILSIPDKTYRIFVCKQFAYD